MGLGLVHLLNHRLIFNIREVGNILKYKVQVRHIKSEYVQARTDFINTMCIDTFDEIIQSTYMKVGLITQLQMFGKSRNTESHQQQRNKTFPC